MNREVKANAVRGSLPSTIRGDLHSYGVSPAIRGILERVHHREGFASHHVIGSYVSVAPDNGRPAASFIHRERLTVAMSPQKAESVGARYGWKVERKTGLTSYVKIPATGLATETQRATAVELLVEAIRWRALGT